MRRLLIYLLFLTSGAAGLVYEVIWMRAMRLVLGSSVEAAATVLATFLGGLAVGSFIGARLSRTGNPLRRYAVAEWVVAVTALGVPLWLAAYRLVFPTLYAWAGEYPLALASCRVTMAFLAMGPPAVAMGTTLPLVTRAVVSALEHFAWHTGMLYALNTFGAMCGALAAGIFLPIWLGIDGSIYLAVSINTLVGIVAWRLSAPPLAAPALDKGATPVPRATIQSERSSARDRRVAPALLLLAALSGFGSLALEVIYFRILSFRSEGSVYSFSLMLVFTLGFLALAAVWVATNLDRQDGWRFLAWTQLAAVAVLLVTPLVFHALPFLAGYEAADTFAVRMARYAITSAVILGPSMLLIGVVLPVTWKMAVSDLEQSGAAVGVLTGVNTLAAVAGSLTAGFLLLPRLGLGRAALVVAMLYALIATLAFLRAPGGTRRLLLALVPGAMVAAWALAGGWRWQVLRMEKGQRLVSYHDGADATVAVIERSDGHRVLKVNHDYTLGSSAGADREVRQGRLPLMLHPDPRRVALVGVATGMTASAVLDFPVERVAAVELLPGVADTLPLFSKWNRNVAADARVELVVEDGRNFLAGTSEAFDVIISDLFVPWQAATGDLYSVEHFAAVRRRLAPGGVFGQCLPGYQLSLEELRCITASLLEVFPHTVLWRNDFNVEYPILCLTGFRDQLSLSTEAVRAYARRLQATTGTAAKFLADPVGLPLLYVCGPEQLAAWARGAPLNTDAHPLIEYSSPRSFFQHRQSQVEPLHDFLSNIRNRTWPFAGQPSECPLDELFQAADLINESLLAFRQNNFEREFRQVLQLARLAGDIPPVAGFVMNVASRYRSRQMSGRSIELLTTLVGFPDPPAAALLALAQEHKADHNNQEAIDLLEKVIDRSPELSGPRRLLIDMLEQEAEYGRAELHLRELIQAKPDNPYLRIDLVQALHRQDKVAAARAAMGDFREAWDGSGSKAVWSYLRTKGLGSYVDNMPPQSTVMPPPDQPPALPTTDPPAIPPESP